MTTLKMNRMLESIEVTCTSGGLIIGKSTVDMSQGGIFLKVITTGIETVTVTEQELDDLKPSKFGWHSDPEGDFYIQVPSVVLLPIREDDETWISKMITKDGRDFLFGCVSATETLKVFFIHQRGWNKTIAMLRPYNLDGKFLLLPALEELYRIANEGHKITTLEDLSEYSGWTCEGETKVYRGDL